MNDMSKLQHIIIGGILCVFLLPIYADTEQMNETLARISHIFSQINPLINEAEQEQDPSARIKFNFDVLREDVGKIQAGIDEQLNPVSIEPRQVEPLKGDYLDTQNNEAKGDT